MASSETEICNSALIKLGSRRITSLDDDSKEGRLCKEQYPKKRDDLLRAHPWNFAMKQVQLAEESTTPLTGFNFTHQFPLPQDCLRVWKTDFESETIEQWEVQGRKLLAIRDEVKIKYISKVTDTSQFDTNFTEVLAVLLAFDLSYSLVQSTSLTQSLFQLYLTMLRDARSLDAQEGYVDIEVQSFDWINQRS